MAMAAIPEAEAKSEAAIPEEITAENFLDNFDAQPEGFEMPAGTLSDVVDRDRQHFLIEVRYHKIRKLLRKLRGLLTNRVKPAFERYLKEHSLDENTEKINLYLIALDRWEDCLLQIFRRFNYNVFEIEPSAKGSREREEEVVRERPEEFIRLYGETFPELMSDLISFYNVSRNIEDLLPRLSKFKKLLHKLYFLVVFCFREVKRQDRDYKEYFIQRLKELQPPEGGGAAVRAVCLDLSEDKNTSCLPCLRKVPDPGHPEIKMMTKEDRKFSGLPIKHFPTEEEVVVGCCLAFWSSRCCTSRVVPKETTEEDNDADSPIDYQTFPHR